MLQQHVLGKLADTGDNAWKGFLQPCAQMSF